MRKRIAFWPVVAVLFFIGDAVLYGQLRIVEYNTAGGPRAGMGDILSAIGAEEVNGIAKPPDVLILQEQRSGTTRAIVDLLNGIFGADTYAMAILHANSTGGGTGVPSLIFNTGSVELVGQSAASIANTSGGARETLRYQLRPAGYDATADFFVYSSHYKAGNSSSDRNRRNVEAVQVRANADALGEGTHVIYAGDFNVYRSSEPAFQTLLASGPGQAFDPIDRLDWMRSRPRWNSISGGFVPAKFLMRGTLKSPIGCPRRVTPPG